MEKADRIPTVIETNFHPVSHYETPADVLCDGRLSAGEKRIILSSWASDMYAVDSSPGLRKVPGLAHAIRLSDILAALRELDGPFDPPPGGVSMRPWRPLSLDVIGRKAVPARDRPVPRSSVASSGQQQFVRLRKAVLHRK